MTEQPAEGQPEEIPALDEDIEANPDDFVGEDVRPDVDLDLASFTEEDE